MQILGISCFYHDSAAALVVDGEIASAVQEERFTRVKHDKSFPLNAISYCLQEANISLDQIDRIVFYENPKVKFNRLLETYLAYAPHGYISFLKSMTTWFSGKSNQTKLIVNSLENAFPLSSGIKDKVRVSEHHLSHAASAFYPSPFEKSLILTMDGVGEWATTSVAIGNKNKIEILKQINFPHSIGLLYSAVTQYLGFKVNSGEYKVMGLAPYGSPVYSSLITENLINVKEDGSFSLNMKYFDYCSGFSMINRNFEELFGAPAREPESELTQRDMDIAASIQQVIEDVVLKITRNLRASTGIRNLCLAGGVALNCVANGKIAKEEIFDGIWIQPAAGDAGGAVGAALNSYYSEFNKERVILPLDSMKGAYLGPEYSIERVTQELDGLQATYQILEYKHLIKEVSRLLADGKVIGWHQGRMEFGPRSLGARSILADPRSPNIQKQLNLKIKYRESFRPFAPSVLLEKAGDWFQIHQASPYMLIVSEINDEHKINLTNEQSKLFGIEKLNIPKSKIPAVTHVDYSARIQTVNKKINPTYHSLIEAFGELTGCPILVNTSFNVRGEPLVCSPTDSFNCFMGTEMDVLVIGNAILYKNLQDKSLMKDYKGAYELD